MRRPTALLPAAVLAALVVLAGCAPADGGSGDVAEGASSSPAAAAATSEPGGASPAASEDGTASPTDEATDEATDATEPEDDPGPVPSFDDLGELHGPAVRALAEARVVDGCGEGRFCPGADLTRAEMAKLLVGGFDLPTEDVPDAFDDDDGRLLEPWINALAASGITSGCGGDGATTYCPDETVTRAQLAAFTVRAAELDGEAEFFTDDEGSPFEEAIEAATVAGLVVGCGPYRFCPGRAVTRAQAATQLARALELVDPATPPVERARLEGLRLVMPYGRPGAAVLGILGEQGVQATMERAQALAADYEGLDRLVPVPAIEIITSLATGAPTEDGDYSSFMADDELRTWVDAAEEAGVEVILDLQPGRTDFLTQAKELEEFLLEPHVGLALDPEWRLEPDEVHLEQIGSVTASEVNRTGAWFARLARDNDLPQQLFLVHQFRLDMITGREDLRTWPELREVIQMDGQGGQSAKIATWNRMTEDPPAGWQFGWKHFYDEDLTLRSPADTVSLRPRPILVSYQ